MFKSIFILSCLLVVSACQTTENLQQTPYSVSTDSRIRLYGQNQKPTLLEYEVNGKKEKINVGGGAGDAFSSLIGTVKNTSIGIAQTEMSKNLKDYNGILSKIFYKEFVIPADHPVRIHNAFIGLSNISYSPTATTVHYQGSCDSLTLTFTPKAGKAYEAIPKYNSAACGLILLEIDANGNTAEVTLTNSANK